MEGLGFRVSGLGRRVWGLRFKAEGFGFRIIQHQMENKMETGMETRVL